MPDILFILLLALLIFGPKKFPEVARQIAKLVAQFRMMSTDLRRQLENEMLKIELEEREKQSAPAPKRLEAETPATPAETAPPTPLT